MLDLNNAPEQRDYGQLIPDGTFVKLKGKIRDGGATLPSAAAIDAGLFKLSTTSDAVMLDWEFTITDGPHAKRNLWQFMTVEGGARDDKGASKAGNITSGTLRAMLESALGIDPKDMSAEAKAKRASMRGFRDFDGIEFAARVGIEAGGAKDGGGYYNDKNTVAHIVVPNEPEWRDVMEGKEVAAKPSNATPRSGGGKAADAAKPAWQRDAAPATAGAAGAPAWAGGTPGPATPAAQPATQATAEPAGATAGAPAGDGPAWMRQ